jgi:hypothetical protein
MVVAFIATTFIMFTTPSGSATASASLGFTCPEGGVVVVAVELMSASSMMQLPSSGEVVTLVEVRPRGPPLNSTRSILALFSSGQTSQRGTQKDKESGDLQDVELNRRVVVERWVLSVVSWGGLRVTAMSWLTHVRQSGEVVAQ